MKAGIIDSPNRAGFWETSIGETFECIIAADISGLNECDILLISEEYCGGAIGTVIENIRANERLCRVPAAAVTTEGGCENQEILLGLGFDDVIILPACGELLKRRALSLAEMSSSCAVSRHISLDSLMDVKDGECGAYYVCSDEFEHIYRFVLRVLERINKKAQVLVLKLHGGNMDKYSHQTVMDTLSSAVKLCLRRGDMASVCGDDRVLVLLIGADDEGGHLVASRIVSSFYSECDDSDFELTYDIRAVNAGN